MEFCLIFYVIRCKNYVPGCLCNVRIIVVAVVVLFTIIIGFVVILFLVIAVVVVVLFVIVEPTPTLRRFNEGMLQNIIQ